MLNDKIILVNGGIGSFGRSFIITKVIKSYLQKKLIVFSSNKLKQYVMQKKWININSNFSLFNNKKRIVEGNI